MGSLQAMEMAALADRDTALRWHLWCNHFPPVHEVFVPVAKQAIELATEARFTGDYTALWDTVLELPNGHRMTAHDIVEGLHLWSFVDTEEEVEA